jgi:hypothetical protein
VTGMEIALIAGIGCVVLARVAARSRRQISITGVPVLLFLIGAAVLLGDGIVWVAT